MPGAMPCLKDYQTATFDRPAETGLCYGYVGAAAETAAQIIVKTGLSCGINPRVLLVLLQKEQGLVTATRPTERKYLSATGYRCPDDGSCDPQYAGFVNQVYMAARRFRDYELRPTSFNHRAGVTSFVQYHPNTACGGTPVTMRSQATAGLYNYTPYQPNAAALNNLSGTGDACSAYGNRNFWRIFNEWFGSTIGGSFLLRTAANPRVYLVVGSQKHPIERLDTFQALAPLGPLGYVSQQYLDRLVTGGPVGRFVKGADRVYMVDAGRTMHVSSCTLVADFGGDCLAAVLLTDSQLQAFTAGPPLTRLVSTDGARRFYVTGGQRREVASDAALAREGISGTFVTLSLAAVGQLAYGVPVAVPGTVARDRSSGALTLLDGVAAHAVPAALATQTTLTRDLPSAVLDPGSISASPQGAPVNGFVQTSDATASYVLTAGGKSLLGAAADWGARFTPLPPEVLALVADAAPIAVPAAVKSATAPQVYRVENGRRRLFETWGDLLATSGGVAPPIWVLPDPAVPEIPIGPAILPPGAMVKASTQPQLYLVDGLVAKAWLTSFADIGELGLTSIRVVDVSRLAEYATAPAPVRLGIDCAGVRTMAAGGGLRQVPDRLLAAYGPAAIGLSRLTCDALPRLEPMRDFVRTPDGTIYLMEAGLKRPIGAYSTWLALGGTLDKTTQLSAHAAASIPTGASL